MSTVLLILAMAAWAVGASVVGSRWHGVRPPELDGYDDHEKIAALRAFLALHVYLNIRRWRRVIVTGGLVFIVVAWGVYEDEQRDIQSVKDACEIRVESRADVRSLGVGMVDEVADFAQIPAADRAELERRAKARALRELPPPDC